MASFASIIDNQRKFFLSNATKSIDFRIQQLQKLKMALQQHEEEMSRAIYLDFKKSDYETYTTELALVYGDIKEAIKKVKKWSKIKKVRTNSANFPAKSYLVPEPLGVALIIGAWNYPYQLTFAPLVAAITAGCTAVVKPSEIPENTSKTIASIIQKTFASDYITVIEGDVAVTTNLLEERFDKIFFTGSTSVGKIVYQAAAKYLTPVTLELGGKSPAFVTESCNIAMAAKRLTWAKYLNAGQTCIAPDYVLVHQSIEQQFIEAIKNEINQAKYTINNKNYVQIINKHHFQRLIRLIDSSKIAHGGNFDENERVIEPTILSNVNFSDAIMQEEIFGPILPIITYTNLKEVVDQVKKMEKPLSCYLFTAHNKDKQHVLSELSFGGGAINDAVMHISNSNIPFGGVGNSGMGSYHGKAGFDAFTHYKGILDKATWLEFKMKYSPYTDKKLRMIKKMLG
ncbi:MAG: aldehyde dehydrogenase [Crocinitomicaceae bacterium]|nr:aldehyde dehydrogenase [Crocinitomicaceae bacterium]